MRDESNDSTGEYCKSVVEEGVLGPVVSGGDWLFEADGVDDGGGRGNVKDFHAGVVEGVEGGEEVKVAGDEYDEEELLSATGYPCGILYDT